MDQIEETKLKGTSDLGVEELMKEYSKSGEIYQEDGKRFIAFLETCLDRDIFPWNIPYIIASFIIEVYNFEEIQRRPAMMQYAGHTREVQHIGLDFSKRGRMFTGSFDKNMKMWDVASGQCLKTFDQEHTDGISHIVMSKDGEHVYTGSKDFTVKKWHIESGKVMKSIRMKSGQIWSFILSRTEDYLFAGCYGANVDMYDIQTASKVKCIGSHSDGVRSLALAEHDTILYSGSSDSKISKWDINGISPDDSAKKLKQFNGHSKQINSIIVNSTGTLLASGSYDLSVRLWDLQEETDDAVVSECAHIFKGHRLAVWQVLFSKDDKFLFSAADCIKIWSISKKQCVASFGGNLVADGVGCIALSPDGARVFTGGKNSVVKKWYLKASRFADEAVDEDNRPV